MNSTDELDKSTSVSQSEICTPRQPIRVLSTSSRPNVAAPLQSAATMVAIMKLMKAQIPSPIAFATNDRT